MDVSTIDFIFFRLDGKVVRRLPLEQALGHCATSKGDSARDIEDITCPRVDMNFIFECSTRYLTSERRLDEPFRTLS